MTDFADIEATVLGWQDEKLMPRQMMEQMDPWMPRRRHITWDDVRAVMVRWELEGMPATTQRAA